MTSHEDEDDHEAEDDDDHEAEDDDDHEAEQDDDDHENDDTATGAEARKIGCLQQSALGNSCGSGPISSISSQRMKHTSGRSGSVFLTSSSTLYWAIGLEVRSFDHLFTCHIIFGEMTLSRRTIPFHK